MGLLKHKSKKIFLTKEEYKNVKRLFENAKQMSINCEPQLGELLKLSKNKSLWNKIKGSERDLIRNLASSYSFIQKSMERLYKFNIEDNYETDAPIEEVKKSKTKKEKIDNKKSNKAYKEIYKQLEELVDEGIASNDDWFIEELDKVVDCTRFDFYNKNKYNKALKIMEKYEYPYDNDEDEYNDGAPYAIWIPNSLD